MHYVPLGDQESGEGVWPQPRILFWRIGVPCLTCLIMTPLDLSGVTFGFIMVSFGFVDLSNSGYLTHVIHTQRFF